MLTIRHKDEKRTSIVTVRYGAADEMPMEKHINFKFSWDMERLASMYYEKEGQNYIQWIGRVSCFCDV